MGAPCGKAMKATNQPVKSANNYKRPASDGEVHIIICALDYKQTSNPLTCTFDGNNMQDLCRTCGIQDVTVMYDEQCTNQRVKAAIEEVGGRCGDDDYFIFYYSGHGTNVEDHSGDEDDGQDEAFCFVSPDGQISYETLMTDDDFADAVTSSVPEETRVLILTDCCHSGTIADLDKPEWANREAISITGCLDSQTSGDMGKGGFFTHAMLLAIDALQKQDEEEYSVGMLYNSALHFDDEMFQSAQDITIQTSSSTNPSAMAWPLVPMGDYSAPLNKAMSGGGGGMSYGAPSAGGGGDNPMAMLAGLAASNPAMLQQLGIPPAIAQMAASTGGDPSKFDLAQMAAGAAGCNVQ